MSKDKQNFLILQSWFKTFSIFTKSKPVITKIVDQ